MSTITEISKKKFKNIKNNKRTDVNPILSVIKCKWINNSRLIRNTQEKE